MNWKTFLLAAVSGYLVLLIVGVIWHFFILRGYYEDILKLNVSAVVVGDMLRALLLAYLYPFGMKGRDWRVTGTKFGAWMGGPDYTQWHGVYGILEILYQLQQMAQAKIAAGGK